MAESWTTCRPSKRFLKVWLYSTCSAFALLATAFTFIDLHGGLLLWCILPVLAAILWTILVRVRLRYNDCEIQYRYFRTVDRKWSEAIGWSYFLSKGRIHLYVRFSNGMVFGSNALILNRAEIIELIPLLMKNIGEPLRDDQLILPPPPWPFRTTISHQVR